MEDLRFFLRFNFSFMFISLNLKRVGMLSSTNN